MRYEVRPVKSMGTSPLPHFIHRIKRSLVRNNIVWNTVKEKTFCSPREGIYVRWEKKGEPLILQVSIYIQMTTSNTGLENEAERWQGNSINLPNLELYTSVSIIHCGPLFLATHWAQGPRR